MKNKIKIIGMLIILILANTITCYANTDVKLQADYFYEDTTVGTTVKLRTDKEEVNVGEIFSVTLRATCPDGINGIDTTYSYDKEKLELISASVKDTNFASLGVDNQITVISNSTDQIQSAEIFVLNFKVKEGVTVGSKATVSIAETLLDSDAATNSEHTIPAQEISITIIEEVDGPGTDKPENEMPETDKPETEKPETDTPGTEEPGTQEPETQEPETQEPGTQEPETQEPEIQKPETQKPEIQEPGKEETKKEEDKKDDTVAKNEIPKAGFSLKIVIAMIIITVVAILVNRQKRKYHDIK